MLHDNRFIAVNACSGSNLRYDFNRLNMILIKPRSGNQWRTTNVIQKAYWSSNRHLIIDIHNVASGEIRIKRTNDLQSQRSTTLAQSFICLQLLGYTYTRSAEKKNKRLTQAVT